MKKNFLSFIIFLFISSLLAFSQAGSSFKFVELNYKDYLEMIANQNLEYSAEKFNLSIADAGIEAARVFQDPSLAFEWAQDKENNAFNGNSFSAEISKTFELGSKRKARIDLAGSESSLVNALLADYFRNLQADATLDYLSALKQDFLYKVMQSSYEMMRELCKADSIRLTLGSIKAIDAIQSKIEAEVLQNELIQINAERTNAFIQLSSRTSNYLNDTLYFPVIKTGSLERSFQLNDLINTALNNRTDLLVAGNNVSYKQNLLNLTKRERVMGIDLNLGKSNTYFNSGISSPTASTVYAELAIPLQFSNFNKGEIKIARFQISQAELLYKSVETGIKNEVLQSYNLYTSLCRQAENYKQGLLEQTKDVLNGKIYSYSRGETSLLEVLNAQRTYNDLQFSYYETMYNCYAALVELERAAGIWDLDL